MNDIDLENVPPTLAATSKKQIIFTYHALEKMYDRELAESWIIDSLIN